MTTANSSARREARREAGCNIQSYVVGKSAGNSRSAQSESSTGCAVSPSHTGGALSTANGSSDETSMPESYFQGNLHRQYLRWFAN
jgi:hypothetical protein